MLRSIYRAYVNAYKGLPREIWLLSLALFVNRCGTMVLPFLTLYLHEELAMEQGYAAQMLSLYGLGAIVGTYSGGRLTEKVGAVRLVILLLMLSVPVFLVIPFLDTVAEVGIAIFVLAIFSEGVRPANGTAIAHYAPAGEQTRAFGLQRMALNLGVSFGPAIGGLLAEINFSWLFIADGLSTLFCAVLLLGTFGWKQETLDHAPSEPDRKPNERLSKRNGSPLRDMQYLAFLGLVMVGAVIFFQFHATYPLYLTEYYGFTKSNIGLLFAVNTVIIVIFEMLLVDRARRWNLLRTVGWGFVFSCIGFGILPFSTAVWFCVFSMVIITVGEMLSMPLASGWVAIRSEGKQRGMYMAWYSMTYSFASVLAPLVGGICYQYNPNLIWYFSIGLAFVVGVGFYWLAANVGAAESKPQTESEVSEAR